MVICISFAIIPFLSIVSDVATFKDMNELFQPTKIFPEVDTSCFEADNAFNKSGVLLNWNSKRVDTKKLDRNIVGYHKVGLGLVWIVKN